MIHLFSLILGGLDSLMQSAAHFSLSLSCQHVRISIGVSIFCSLLVFISLVPELGVATVFTLMTPFDL